MNRPPLLTRIKPFVDVFDRPLLLIWGLLLCVSCVTMWSAAYGFPGRFDGHLRNIIVAFVALWVASMLSTQAMMRLAIPLYVTGVVLLVAVALFGDISKGARRWLNLGFARIQPSEMLKLAVPLMLAWYFHKREGILHAKDWAIAAALLAIPVLLIAKQPDLGTALLVLAAGIFVLFFAGMSWRLVIVVSSLVFVGVVLIIVFGDSLCEPGVDWHVLREYQRQRVCTLLDPTRDPLGKGFHIIQSIIAVGSGGAFGKGWLQGTQTHLEFLPERTTDFIFAAYAEEFGLLGAAVLIALYSAMVLRGLWLAGHAPQLFGRLLGGSLSLAVFVYAFVNMGMVTGILPVVGVPLPWMSYGGTAMLTLALALGIQMSIARERLGFLGR